MNVYDQAHSLAKAIKESNEFIEFDQARRELEKDEQSSTMMKDMHQLQMEMQTAQMTGEQVSEELFGKIQSLSTMIATKPVAATFLQKEAVFSVMMNDVFQIIGEAVGMGEE